MARGGKREGAGRPTGAATQKTREIADKAAEEGITPLEVMLEAMRFHYAVAENEIQKGAEMSAKLIGDALEAAREAARDAAPYVHPKLSSVEHSGSIARPHEDVLEDLD